MKPIQILSSILLSFTVLGASGSAQDVSQKSSGIDKTLFSDEVSAGENFYRHANQKWLEKTQIPSDKSDYGIFTMLNDLTREQVRELIESAAQQKTDFGSASQKVGDLYESVLNTKARDEAGIGPIGDFVLLINRVNSKREFSAAMGSLSRAGVDAPFGIYVNNDAKDSDQYAVYVSQSGLTMPDRDYYLEDDERYVVLRGEVKTYIADMLTFLGVVDASAAAQRVLEIETKIAEKHWTKTENRDPEKTYNSQSREEMTSLLGSFNWAVYADTSGISGQKKFIARQPSYFSAFSKIFEEVQLEDWKNYLRLRLADSFATSLSDEMEKRHFDFHRTAISGISEQEPLWKRGVNVTGSVLGELVGQLYVEHHFKPEAKARMNELVENLKRAFAERIHTRDWMSEGTKKQAIEKLAKFTTKIGYPDQWKDYTALSIKSPLLAKNMIAAAEFEHHRELKKLGGPIDRSEWHMTPQTINAYYNPVMNEIVFPAAILQPPFFNMNADDAVNYGAIGAVIGHELSHGFDDKGSKYDGNGNLRMWWTQSDRAEFERRAQGLVTQYSEFEPVDGNFVNGNLTLGENIGDLGGLNVAHHAYHLSLDQAEAPVINAMTGDQRFFLGWSQIWRRLYRQRELLKRLVTDPHSPSEYRVNGIVRNMDAWYEAFGIKTGDPMFLEPQARVRIW